MHLFLLALHQCISFHFILDLFSCLGVFLLDTQGEVGEVDGKYAEAHGWTVTWMAIPTDTTAAGSQSQQSAQSAHYNSESGSRASEAGHSGAA